MDKEPGLMEKKELLRSGVTADCYALDEENRMLVLRKDAVLDEASGAWAEVPGKGAVCSRMTAHLYRQLEAKGIRTAFVEEVTDTECVFRRTEEFPFLVKVRNYAAGSYVKRTGLAEGTALAVPAAELRYLKEGLGLPMINGYDVLAMKLAGEAEIEEIVKTAFAVNEALTACFRAQKTDLIDVTLRFGKEKEEIFVTGELSPDTMRLWDAGTHEKLDADRFRRGLGNVEDAYREAFRRLGLTGER